DDPFLQWQGNTYWLAIIADASRGVWGWKTSEDHWNNDAMWKSLSRGERDTLLSEGFEDCYPGGIPPTWLMLTNDSYEYGEWTTETYYVHSGHYSVEGNPGSPSSIPHSDAWLISERRSLSSSPGDLTFWYRSESDDHWVKFHVLVSTSPDPYDYSAYTIVADLNASSTTWTEASIDMSAYANQDVYIAWRMYDSDVGYYYMFIDDVALDGWTEGFEGKFPPAGWTVYDHDGQGDTWVLTDYSANTGNYSTRCAWDVPNDDWLVTPLIPLSGYTNTELHWYYKDDDYWDIDIEIWLCTTGNTPDDFLTNGVLLYDFDNPHADDEWHEGPTISLDGYGDAYIAFRYVSDNQLYAYIDDISVTGEAGAPPAEWTELHNPEPPYESLDMAFAIEGTPKGTVYNVNTDKWFTTIQDAIDDPETKDGHTIIAYLPMPEVFPSGKYEENINIHKSIILVANATEAPSLPPSVIIDGGQAGPTVTISADNVVIDGFEIINGTYGIYSAGTSGSSIINCIIHDNLNGGIKLEDSYGNTIAGCDIYGEGTGVHLVGSDGNTIYDNDIGGVTTGIILEDSVLNYIHDNVLGDYSTGVWCLSNDDTNYINFNAFGKPCALKNVAIQNDDDVVVEAQYNWYGQDDGPGGYVADAVTGRIADGDGEKIVGNIHFDPWIGIDAKIVTDHIAVLEGEVIYFDASESFHCDASGSLQDDLRYEWDLGDGSRQFLKSFGYVYDEPGVYKVTLHVSAPDPIDEDNGVLDDFATVYITVSARGQPLKADAHPEEIYGDSGDYYYGDVGEPIQFYGLATGGVPDYTFEWDFGDGTTAVGQNPVHAYSEAGVYTVTLTVTDSEGNIATDTAIAVIGTTEEQPSEGGVNISCIKGGFGIKATINNTLDEPVDWSIDVNVSGFGFIFIGGHANGTIPAGTEETVSSGLIFGIGKIDIVVTADDVTKEATGFLLGPFVLGVKEA
ncbi:MAG: PKD domain-containing protein, partial [Thermoplasmata archaeon]